MKSDHIKLRQAYIRLPRFKIELYEKIILAPLEDFLDIILSKDYMEFLDLLEVENYSLFSSIKKAEVDLGVKVSTVNYLMRCTARCTPYKGYATIEQLNVSNVTTLFNTNKVSFRALDFDLEEEEIIVKNPALQVVDDIIVSSTSTGVKKLKSQGILDYLSLKDSFDIDNLTNFEKKLLSQGVLSKVKKGSFYSEYDQSSRIDCKVSLSANEIDRCVLEAISEGLTHLSFLNGNNINKSLLWLEKIYETLFNRYGTGGQSLVSLVNGSSVFKIPPNELLSEAQTKVCPQRQYFLNLLSTSSYEDSGEIVLTEKHISELKALSQKRVRTNLSKDFSVILKLLEGANKAFVSYFRSSFLGVRPLAEYVQKVEEDEFTNNDSGNAIYADILCSIKKNILLRRPRTTNYYISVDGSFGDAKQTSICLDDLYLQAGSGELVLYSKSLKKRVIPVLTTCYLAENDSNHLYRFLAALAKSHFNDGLHIDLLWTQRDFLPQISYKDIILFPKTWLIPKEQLEKKRAILPSRVRLIDNDRDQLLYVDSSYFSYQALKAKGELLHFQEDMDCSKLIRSEGATYLNEIAYRFETPQQQDPIYFKDYSSVLSLYNDHITQLNIYAPEEFLDIIMYKIFNEYLKGVSFFYINYQFPDSHIRLRIINNSGLTDKLFNELQISDEFYNCAISQVQRVSYESEVGTYLDAKGVQLYTKASEQLSLKVLLLKDYFLKNSIGQSLSSGPILETIYLSFLAYYLLRDLELIDKNLNSKVSYSEFKKINSHIISSIADESSSTFKMKQSAYKTYLLVRPLIEQWDRHCDESGYSKPLGFFQHRLIHMDIFRLTNGTYSQMNQFVLRLAYYIDKSERLRV